MGKKLPALRQALINGAKSTNNSIEGDLFGKKTETERKIF